LRYSQSNPGACLENKGGGAAQNSASVAPRMRGKCVAQETLKLTAGRQSRCSRNWYGTIPTGF